MTVIISASPCDDRAKMPALNIIGVKHILDLPQHFREQIFPIHHVSRLLSAASVCTCTRSRRISSFSLEQCKTTLSTAAKEMLTKTYIAARFITHLGAGPATRRDPQSKPPRHPTIRMRAYAMPSRNRRIPLILLSGVPKRASTSHAMPSVRLAESSNGFLQVDERRIAAWKCLASDRVPSAPGA